MNGDYTKVPLRASDRWTGARMQEGRVLLDHEWNLNLDASARSARASVADAIGPVGVVEGSEAFRVALPAEGDLDLTVAAGRIWVDGRQALAPAAFAYSDQEGIEALPEAGLALVYLDVFEEHVHPSEDPEALVDPALAPVDSAARTRVGYRVRVLPTQVGSCKEAAAELAASPLSTGRLSISRQAAPAPPDPCDPPGDPLGRVPDGLFRVEVLDGGDAAHARFAWSFENGGVSVAVAEIAGSEVTLRPSRAAGFADGDLVEVSWLARRADRADHGALYSVTEVKGAAAGDILTLDRPPVLPEGAVGIAVRRWDGQSEGASASRAAAFRGADIGVRFLAAAGSYEAGDWWGARLRDGNGSGIEERAEAEPDGTAHAFAPLALVDLEAREVLSDCRPKFRPLTQLKGGACTVVAHPGDDLQAAIDAIPQGGGSLCLSAGTFELRSTLELKQRRHITISGSGPATVLRAIETEAAVIVENCDRIELREMRIEGGSPGDPRRDPHLNGAVTVIEGRSFRLRDCIVTCPQSTGRTQTCVTVRQPVSRAGNRVRIERCLFGVPAGQTGVLAIVCDEVEVIDNHLVCGGEGPAGQGIVVSGRGGSATIVDNVVERFVQGIHVGASSGEKGHPETMDRVLVRGNRIHLQVPADYKRERHAVFVGNAESIEVLDTHAHCLRTGESREPTRVEAIRLYGHFGPYVSVRRSLVHRFDVAIVAVGLPPFGKERLWVVAETICRQTPTLMEGDNLWRVEDFVRNG